MDGTTGVRAAFSGHATGANPAADAACTAGHVVARRFGITARRHPPAEN